MLQSVNILKENIQDGSKVAENDAYQFTTSLVDEILSGCWNLINYGGKAKVVHDPDPKAIHFAYLRKMKKKIGTKKHLKGKKRKSFFPVKVYRVQNCPSSSKEPSTHFSIIECPKVNTNTQEFSH